MRQAMQAASTSEVDGCDAPNDPMCPTIVINSQSVGSGRKRPIPVNEDDNITMPCESIFQIDMIDQNLPSVF